MKQDKPDISVILEYYGARVHTRRGWFSIKCPFHDDSHASATVSLDNNAFACFACQMKGDGYGIIMKKEGVEFIEAVNIAKRIFDQSGKALPQRTTRSGGIPRRTGHHAGAGNSNASGRRARAISGA